MRAASGVSGNAIGVREAPVHVLLHGRGIASGMCRLHSFCHRRELAGVRQRDAPSMLKDTNAVTIPASLGGSAATEKCVR